MVDGPRHCDDSGPVQYRHYSPLDDTYSLCLHLAVQVKRELVLCLFHKIK